MKKALAITTILCLAAMAGCVKEKGPDNGPKGTSMVTITLRNGVEIGGGKVRGVTEQARPATADEKKITVLEFYVFNPNGTPDEEVFNTATPDDKGYYKIVLDPLGSATTLGDATYSMKVSAGTNKKILVAANMTLGPLTPTMNNYDKVKAAVSTGSFTSATSRTIPAAGLEMSGVSESNEIIAGVNVNVPVFMTRLTSKIVTPAIPGTVAVELTQAEADLAFGANVVDVSSDDISFEFQGYAVINGIDKSNVRFVGRADGNYKTPESAAWSDWATNSATKTYPNGSSFDNAGAYTANYSGGGFLAADGTAAPVYVYENKPGRITLPGGAEGYNPAQVYSLIIKGKLTSGANEAPSRYWRVNLTKIDIYHVMRNCVYEVEISKIQTPGYPTPEDAENGTTVVPDPNQAVADFVINVAEWDLNAWSTPM